MATLTETVVVARVRMARDPDGTNRIYVAGESQTVDGTTIRSYPEQDVTAALTAGQLAHAVAILDFVVARLKSAWSIA